MERTIIDRILKENIRREYRILSRYACKSRSGTRRTKEKSNGGEDIRPQFSRDVDRIMHSLAYSRYIDKTQVFYLFENDHITHRVLHVQFVSKIARVIGRCLRLNEDLIEAIALGHDIGHPPFGHNGEKILNKFCKDYRIGCFAHNVQSVRFLMDIEKNYDNNELNLTLQVLDGILTHNGEKIDNVLEPNRNKDWDIFLGEYDSLINDKAKELYPMTLEGCVVRVSDIIAYIGRDLEDARTLKIINEEDEKSIPKEIIKILGCRGNINNDSIIKSLVVDIIENSYDKNYIKMSNQITEALNLLLEFNKNKIYKNKSIQTQDHKIEFIFEYMFDKLVNILRQGTNELEVNKWLNERKETYKKENTLQRIAIDYISGMTDGYLIKKYEDCSINEPYIKPMSFGYCINKNNDLN